MSDVEKVVINGTMKSSFTTQKENDVTHEVSQRNVIVMFKDAKTKDGKQVFDLFDEIYEHVADKWKPNWYKEKKDFALKSEYDIPVKINDDEPITFERFVKMGKIRDAEVSILCNIKESAIYPVAIKVFKVGVPYDPFLEF